MEKKRGGKGRGRGGGLEYRNEFGDVLNALRNKYIDFIN